MVVSFCIWFQNKQNIETKKIAIKICQKQTLYFILFFISWLILFFVRLKFGSHLFRIGSVLYGGTLVVFFILQIGNTNQLFFQCLHIIGIDYSFGNCINWMSIFQFKYFQLKIWRIFFFVNWCKQMTIGKVTIWLNFHLVQLAWNKNVNKLFDYWNRLELNWRESGAFYLAFINIIQFIDERFYKICENSSFKDRKRNEFNARNLHTLNQ